MNYAPNFRATITLCCIALLYVQIAIGLSSCHQREEPTKYIFIIQDRFDTLQNKVDSMMNRSFRSAIRCVKINKMDSVYWYVGYANALRDIGDSIYDEEKNIRDSINNIYKKEK